MRRRVSSCLLAAAALLLLLIPLLAGAPAGPVAAAKPQNLGTSQPAKPAAALPSCVTGATVFDANYTIPSEWGNFGPNPEAYGLLSAADLANALNSQFCLNWKLVNVYWREIVDPHANVNQRLSLAEWQHRVAVLNQRIIWAESPVVTLTMPAGTRTYGMRPNPNPSLPPTVFRVTIPVPRTSRFLLVAYRAGPKLHLVKHLPSRILCDFQPEAPPGAQP